MPNNLHRATVLALNESMALSACTIIQLIWDNETDHHMDSCQLMDHLSSTSPSSTEQAIQMLRSKLKLTSEGYVYSPVSIEILEAIDTLEQNEIQVDCDQADNLNRPLAYELVLMLKSALILFNQRVELMKECANACAKRIGYPEFTFAF